MEGRKGAGVRLRTIKRFSDQYKAFTYIKQNKYDQAFKILSEYEHPEWPQFRSSEATWALASLLLPWASSVPLPERGL